MCRSRSCSRSRSGEGSSAARTGFIHPRSPSPPPKPVIHPIITLKPIMDTTAATSVNPSLPSSSCVHSQHPTWPRTPECFQPPLGCRYKGKEKASPSFTLSTQTKTAFEDIPVWHQPRPSLLVLGECHGTNTYPYPGDVGFGEFLNQLISWFNLYHPVGLLGTNPARICHAIFFDTGLGVLRQNTLREYWAEQIRLYRCTICDKKWNKCSHRCPGPEAGGYFGLSDDPTELMDDLLVCFGPPKQDDRDHDWGVVPRLDEEFMDVVQYGEWLAEEINGREGDYQVRLEYQARLEYVKALAQCASNAVDGLGAEEISVFREGLVDGLVDDWGAGVLGYVDQALGEKEAGREKPEERERQRSRKRSWGVMDERRALEWVWAMKEMDVAAASDPDATDDDDDDSTKNEDEPNLGWKETAFNHYTNPSMSPPKRLKQTPVVDDDVMMWDDDRLEQARLDARVADELLKQLDEHDEKLRKQD